MTAGSVMAAELAEQPTVLGRLVGRHESDREKVRAVLPGHLAGTVLLARGSSDNVAVYGRYLIELASRRRPAWPLRACTPGTSRTSTTAATWWWR